MNKLLRQFKKWAKGLLKVNPDYVRDPRRLLSYIKGPNWDHVDVEYVHYRDTVAMYGKELLDEFERLRGLPVEDAVTEYEALLRDVGMMSKKDLDAITGYIRDGFGSLGITAGEPFLSDGVVCVNCYGIHPMDSLMAADRIVQAMGRDGWNVDVWLDEMENELKVSKRE